MCMQTSLDLESAPAIVELGTSIFQYLQINIKIDPLLFKVEMQRRTRL